MKKISLLLALLLVLLLASCGKSATAETTTEKETAPTVAAETAGFTLDDVLKANDVKTLVSAYGGVSAARYENDEAVSETYYFMYAGKIVSTTCATGKDGEKTYSCTVDNESYKKVGDRLQFSYNVDAQKKPSKAYLFGDAVSAQMLEGKIDRYEEPDKDSWCFELHDADGDDGVSCRCTVLKKSFILKQIDWDYGDGSTAKVEIKHGADVQTKEFGLLDGFAKDLRTVTCVCTMHDKQGKESEKTLKVQVPYNVEPVWESASDVTVYLDKGLTKAYKYPGNGEKDYTVYVTDAKG